MTLTPRATEVAVDVEVGFGHIDASEIEVPNTNVRSWIWCGADEGWRKASEPCFALVSLSPRPVPFVRDSPCKVHRAGCMSLCDDFGRSKATGTKRENYIRETKSAFLKSRSSFTF
jgi:hypothetical protein